MRREITINELKNEVDSLDDVNEPIIVKRKNKQDLVIISLEQYKKQIFLENLSSKLEKSKKEVAQGKVHSARTIFKEMRAKYGY